MTEDCPPGTGATARKKKKWLWIPITAAALVLTCILAVVLVIQKERADYAALMQAYSDRQDEEDEEKDEPRRTQEPEPEPEPEPDPEPEPEPEPDTPTDPYMLGTVRGNTTGNIVNGGDVTYDETDIWYSKNGMAKDLNSYNGWLYYVDGETGYIMARDLQTGSESSISSDLHAAYLNVVDDYIFYRATDDGYTVHRMDLDGGNNVMLSGLRATRVAAINGYVYFVNWDEGTEGLWRMDYDGEGLACLYSGDVPLYLNIDAEGKFGYFLSYNAGNMLVGIDLETCQTESASSVIGITCLNVYESTVYFAITNPEIGTPGVYQLSGETGGGLTCLYEGGGVMSVFVTNEGVYFRLSGDTEGAEDDLLYMCDLATLEVSEVS